MVPMIDENHHNQFDYAQFVACIVFSERFINLKKELEKIYSRSGVEQPVRIAFQDALYSIIAEEGFEQAVSISY